MLWLMLAGVGWMIRAVILYAREGRYCLNDEMGLSIRFDRRWMVGTLIVAAGVLMGEGVHWAWSLATVVVGYVVILPLKRALAAVFRSLLGWGTQTPPDWRPRDGFKRYAEQERAIRARPAATQSGEDDASRADAGRG